MRAHKAAQASVPRLAFIGSNPSRPIIKKAWPFTLITQVVMSPTKSVAQLKRALTHKKATVRTGAHAMLDRIRMFCIAALEQQHPDTATRTEAARMLGKTGGAEAVAALINSINRVTGDADAGVRVAAVNSLMDIGDPKAITAVLGSLSDRDADVRLAAVQALYQLRNSKDKRIVPALMKTISGATMDPDALVRREAVYGLKKYRDKQTLPSLHAALGDCDAKVRALAALAIGELNDRTATVLLVAMLIGTNRDTDPVVRQDAANALGSVGGTHAVSALMKLIAGPQRDTIEQVRLRAIWSLDAIGEKRCTPALIAALSDTSPMVRAAANEALLKIRGK